MSQVSWTKGKRIPDPRGSFTEAFRNSLVTGPPIQQVNVSKSEEGVLRGIHWHRNQWDYWHLTVGKIQVVIHNPRTGKVTTGVLGMNDGVIIPPGYGHGYLALKPSVLLYGVSSEYDVDNPDEQEYHAYSIGAPWIMAQEGVLMSARDINAPAWVKP